MQFSAAITGCGSYSPNRVLDNHGLEKIIDTDDAWIHSRTGIRERHIAGPLESTSSMSTIAARRALQDADLDPCDLDLVICATTTPDYFLPATACLIQSQIGAVNAGAFDINTACAGFIYALTTASQFIQGGGAKRVLVVAGETLSRFVNWEDRSTCILFGDGAAAVILEATTQAAGVLSTVLGSRGDVEGALRIEAGGSAVPASAETVANKDHTIRMRGNEIFKLAVRAMAQSARQALSKADLGVQDIRAVVAHQANQRILEATRDTLGVSNEQMFMNIERFGNTGAASVPIALNEFLHTSEIDVGENLLFVAFGGGLTWGAAVLRWADVEAVKLERAEMLRPTHRLLKTG